MRNDKWKMMRPTIESRFFFGRLFRRIFGRLFFVDYVFLDDLHLRAVLLIAAEAYVVTTLL